MHGLKHWAGQARDRALRGNEAVWRYGFNLPATVHHRRHPPRLGTEALRVERELQREGVAVTTVEAITGDPTLLPRLQEAARAAEAERRAHPTPAHLRAEAARPFLIHMLDPLRPEVDPEGPFAEVVLHPEVKGVADRYFGLTTRISDLNVWLNAPQPELAGAATQLWHRDLAEDRRIVKVFVYLADVDEGGGPFAYARGTHLEDASRADLTGMEHDGVNYRVVDSDRLAQLERDARVCTGPAGTLVIADVGGLHRGGLALTSPRFMLQARYTSMTVDRFIMLSAPAGVDVRAHRHELLFDRKAARRASPPAAADTREPVGSGRTGS